MSWRHLSMFSKIFHSFFICLMIFIGEYFSSVFPRTFTFALSPAFVEFRLQGAQFPYHPEQKDQIQPY